MNTCTVQQIQITLSEEIDVLISQALGLEYEQNQLKIYSNEWQKIENQLSEIYRKIGAWVVADFNNLPF